ncbi:hypothetical protein AAK967_00180 [Atopobiaceae bacterium 24-176]
MAESEAWPVHARLLGLVRCGFTYGDAWHMSPMDSSRFVSIYNALSIPAPEREGGVVMGGKSDADRIFGG